MEFAYKAKSGFGETSTGLLEAESPLDARKQLRDQGLFPMSVSKSSHASSAVKTTSTSSSKSWSLGAKVSRLDLLTMTSQLSIMCKSGIDVAEALQNVGDQCEKPVFRDALQEVYRDVSDGEAVSAAMRKRPKIFDDTYVASIAAGEISGQLPEVLERLSKLLSNEIRLRSTIRTALSYPMVLTAVSSMVVMALIFFVLPQFAEVFQGMDMPAPFLTQILLDLSENLRSYWWIWGTVSVAGVVTLIRLRTTPAVRRYWDGALLNWILLKTMTQSLYIGRSFRLVGTMLQSGVPLLEAIQMCRTAINNCHYRILFDQMETEVINGKGVGRTLLESSFVPKGAAQMVSTAERTGRLGTVMETVGEFYEDDGERRLIELTKYLEPAIIVCMGVVVAAIVLSIMLPIFDFSTARR